MGKLTDKQEMFLDYYDSIGKFSVAANKSGLNTNLVYGSKYYVYLLVNPINDEIFYIGKGKGKRAEMHLKENKTGRLINAKKHDVINQIRENGLFINVIVFATSLTEDDSLNIEKKMIDRFRDTITNKQSGSLSKHEQNVVMAKNMLAKMEYRDIEVSFMSKEQRRETYDSIVSSLKRLISGEEKWYDTITINTYPNGKQTVKYS